HDQRERYVAARGAGLAGRNRHYLVTAKGKNQREPAARQSSQRHTGRRNEHLWLHEENAGEDEEDEGGDFANRQRVDDQTALANPLDIDDGSGHDDGGNERDAGPSTRHRGPVETERGHEHIDDGSPTR